MTDTPVLEPPGAGLPWWELLYGRHILFPLACRRHSWAGAGRLFQEEGRRILAAWDTLAPEQLRRQVLVRRLPGIEDSSRYWSAAMTVEHLLIVASLVRETIESLRCGDVPAIVIRVAEVKPRGESAPEEVRAAFVRLLEEVAAADATEPSMARGQGPRHQHPWLGPINGFEWRFMMAMHQGLHRRQIEVIRKGITAA
jgi:hypothetical protein